MRNQRCREGKYLLPVTESVSGKAVIWPSGPGAFALCHYPMPTLVLGSLALCPPSPVHSNPFLPFAPQWGPSQGHPQAWTPQSPASYLFPPFPKVSLPVPWSFPQECKGITETTTQKKSLPFNTRLKWLLEIHREEIVNTKMKKYSSIQIHIFREISA